LLVRARHDALPAPRDERLAPATAFVAARAQRHLGALTALGPRVAGSYENEVAAVAVLLRAVKDIARAASPHNTVEVDLHRASGAFPLSFFDGMTNVYRDVQSLVVRVGGAGGGGGDSALLLNCHFDTVPGSPGASDDGAGCAVMLEVLRALAASPRPLRHRAVFLFNGAEENIMQGSHAFITQHPWARSVRAFVNIEACGAGGREVLFQAGPRQPWIMEVYAATVPRPYASSVAQELFESGTIPADTDFRIFRDFGKLSGVDLAWSTNGYVYHTHLDTADRVPLGALQHTGDNVLALTHGLLASEKLEFSGDEDEGQPVFFDVLGLFVVCVRPPAAAAAVAATLLLLLLRTRADAHDARRQLYVPASAWLRALGAMGARLALAVGAGLAAGAAPALLLHAAGARLSYYSRPWLLAPLYALPALGAAALALRRLARAVRLGGAAAGGWWAARLAAAALALLWAALLLLCAAKGLRSGFVALHWALLPALLAQPALVLRASEGCKLAWWCVGSVVPMLQTWYLALGSLHMFVPITGRAGTAPLPPDVMMALLTAALSLAACSWLLPLLLAVRGAGTLARAALAVGALAVALVLCTPLGAPYSATTPQRYMVFHTRRTTHHAPGNVTHEDLYWVPHLDANTPSSLKDHVPLLAQAAWRPQECGAWPYCGAPYCLPVAALVARGYWAAAGPPPLAAAVAARLQPLGPRLAALHLHITGPSHVVVVVAPAEGAEVSWASALGGPPQPGAAWGRRRTYFLALHDALRPRAWNLTLHIQHSFETPPAEWAALSVAGHGMSAPRAPEHEALLARMPAWTAPSGWPVHLHLLRV
ncbi:endoplasmic reticulum metallopeptidase 1-like, partial [Pectinophora gossypiella]|uniref:endoplasmic reticulum metallopeptidase 1-like n=1 Tax=Pectinophora gossypiella TaxID=13191 RepID=UPI00214E2E8B